jgi:hypothetical protein
MSCDGRLLVPYFVIPADGHHVNACYRNSLIVKFQNPPAQDVSLWARCGMMNPSYEIVYGFEVVSVPVGWQPYYLRQCSLFQCLKSALPLLNNLSIDIFYNKVLAIEWLTCSRPFD